MRSFFPAAMDAVRLGAQRISVDEGELSLGLPASQERGAGERLVAAARELRWEGEWDVSLRDPAMEVRFRSTADGEAADARWRANATEGEGHAERLVRLWDATAAKR